MSVFIATAKCFVCSKESHQVIINKCFDIALQSCILIWLSNFLTLNERIWWRLFLKKHVMRTNLLYILWKLAWKSCIFIRLQEYDLLVCHSPERNKIYLRRWHGYCKWESDCCWAPTKTPAWIWDAVYFSSIRVISWYITAMIKSFTNIY